MPEGSGLHAVGSNRSVGQHKGRIEGDRMAIAGDCLSAHRVSCGGKINRAASGFGCLELGAEGGDQGIPGRLFDDDVPEDRGLGQKRGIVQRGLAPLGGNERYPVKRWVESPHPPRRGDAGCCPGAEKRRPTCQRHAAPVHCSGGRMAGAIASVQSANPDQRGQPGILQKNSGTISVRKSARGAGRVADYPCRISRALIVMRLAIQRRSCREKATQPAVGAPTRHHW